MGCDNKNARPLPQNRERACFCWQSIRWLQWEGHLPAALDVTSGDPEISVQLVLGKSPVGLGKDLFSVVDQMCIRDRANTTPESYELQKLFSEMLTAGCDSVVMEVSSQGLMMSRVDGIHFDVGVFTNLYPDHIGGPGEHQSRCV